jgi:alpha-beta hydrolase superfamily lysophospholipase
MKIERQFIAGEGFHVPCVLVTPPDPAGAVVIVHGYGGNKEEQLGLAWRVAETGLAACAIDLRGHGEHMLPFTGDVLDDVEAAIRHCRRYGKVVALGHSLGGRLALLSSADAVIVLSPAICPTYADQIHHIIENSRSYRVREPSLAHVFEVLEELPVWKPDARRTLLVYGSRDMPDIARDCGKLKEGGVRAVEISQALHSDIFLLEPAFEAVKAELANIF